MAETRITDVRVGSPVFRYENTSYHGGVDQRLSGRLIPNICATELLNVDISVPGKRTKRLSPKTVAEVDGVIRGLAEYNGQVYAVADGKLYRIEGGTATAIPGDAFNTDRPCKLLAANKFLYILDGRGDIYRSDGDTVTRRRITKPDGELLVNVSDILWYLNRMWYAVEDFIYVSDIPVGSAASSGTVVAPEELTLAPFRVGIGDGNTIRNLIGYRGHLVLVFKHNAEAGPGSIHVLNASNPDPSQWTLDVVPWFQGVTLCSPRCVVALGSYQDADIAFMTVEGMRTLRFTALDQLVTPSLPFTANVETDIRNIHAAWRDEVHAVVFQDELLLWTQTSNNQYPDLTLSYNMRLPRELPQMGWSRLNMMPATCALVTGALGGARLVLGTADGKIQVAFTARTSDQYVEISKRIDFDDPAADKYATRLTCLFAPDHEGDVTVYLLTDDNDELLVGTYSPSDAGLTLPATFPATFTTGTIEAKAFDLHVATGYFRKRAKDFRVKMVSESYPSIYGFVLEAIPYPWRTTGITDTTAVEISRTPQILEQEGVTPSELGG